jgi:hypothetical protein
MVVEFQGRRTRQSAPATLYRVEGSEHSYLVLYRYRLLGAPRGLYLSLAKEEISEQVMFSGVRGSLHLSFLGRG